MGVLAMAFITEAELEETLLNKFASLGYELADEAKTGPDGLAPERASYGDVLLIERLKAAVNRLNPSVPLEAREDAIRQVIAAGSQSLIEENRRLHRLLVTGVPVEYQRDDGGIRGDTVHLLNFDDASENDWVAHSQFTVIENGVNRRPDVVVFVNGLPLAVIELKNPGAQAASWLSAYQQLQTYKKQIPSLFHTNALLVASDGLTARVGSLTASQERFMPWRTSDGTSVAPKGSLELSTLTEGIFEKSRFLELVKDFIVFRDDGAGVVKIIAGYHQYHAVRHAVRSTITATSPDGDRRVGVIWHTQGSGKSLLMAFYAGQLARHPALENPTIVVITDRNDLDDQLFGTFSACHELIRQIPIQAESREDLRKALDRTSGGVVFTTIQKFSPEDDETEYPVLTDRRNVVVIADEAHRSQYGFKAKVGQESGAISYGFAKYLRDALPAASFIGFTGTPIEASDVNTPAVFGDYIDIYDISRAIEDGATVPIYYESRLARIELPEEAKPLIDAEVSELTEDEAEQDQQRLQRKWATTEALVGSKKRLELVAADLVQHFEDRVAALDGKGMFVCMSRRICVALYDEVIKLRPDWHSEDDNAGSIKVVMTGNASDPLEWQPHIGNKSRRDLIARRAKDPNDPLRLVLVRDMWLTGFDAPAMHTMYVDKPMRGHGLMQAIARVNRVFRDKQGGLIVDYIGIASNLRQAIGDYTKDDQENTGIDEAEAVAVLIEKHEIVKNMFYGFNYQTGLRGTPEERLLTLARAVEFILTQQNEAAKEETSEEGKKKANRRYKDNALALNKAFALASASDKARELRDEIGFFQAVRAALTKNTTSNTISNAEREFAVRQIVDQAVVTTEIIDLLAAIGLETPEISLLSDDFLAEIHKTESKNLAIEALKKLLSDEIRSRSRSNIVESKKFSERLAEAANRYHMNAISAAEIIAELINLARDMRDARARGEEEGLSEDEIAFYDALADNKSAVEVMSNDDLKALAQELLVSLRRDATVDWNRRESTRARMRILVKRILRKYGYPPDMRDEAVKLVIQQAEAAMERWTIGASP